MIRTSFLGIKSLDSLYSHYIRRVPFVFGTLKAHLQAVRCLLPDDINFSHENRAADGHRDGNDWNVDTRELHSPDMDVLPFEDIPPQQPCQRCAKTGTERPIVDTFMVMLALLRMLEHSKT